MAPWEHEKTGFSASGHRAVLGPGRRFYSGGKDRWLTIIVASILIIGIIVVMIVSFIVIVVVIIVIIFVSILVVIIIVSIMVVIIGIVGITTIVILGLRHQQLRWPVTQARARCEPTRKRLQGCLPNLPDTHPR